MAQAEVHTVTTVILTLSEKEATYLKSIVKTAVYMEDPELLEYRRQIFKALNTKDLD